MPTDTTVTTPAVGDGAPQVGSADSNTQAPQAPQAGEADNTTSQSGMTLEQAMAELAKVRREAGGYRTKLKTFEDKAAADALAQMTDLERAQNELATLKQTMAEQARREQERTVRYEIQTHAAKLGIVDPDAAYALMDRSQLEYTDDGTPKNAEKLLKALLTSKPYLAGPVASGSAANPPRDHATSNTFTSAQIAAMSPTEYQKNRAAIFQAYKEGRVTG